MKVNIEQKVMSYQEYLEYMRAHAEFVKVWQTKEKLAFVAGLALGIMAALIFTSIW